MGLHFDGVFRRPKRGCKEGREVVFLNHSVKDQLLAASLILKSKVMSTDHLPEILSLHSQLVLLLKREIAAGTWKSWLPDERSLSRQFHVSRSTIRAALKTLEMEKLVVTRHGLGRQVTVAGGEARHVASNTVGLLSREPLSNARSSYAQQAFELRSLLFEHNLHLEFHTGENYFTKRAAKALSTLTARHSHACWVLHLSSEITQRWFLESKIPCVIAGSCHAGIGLPSLDGDQGAKCRHAAGTLMANGHTRIAFLHASSGTAGDMDSERGFLEAVSQSPRENIKAEVVLLTTDVGDICRKVRKLLSRSERPTALLVSNPHHFVLVMSTIWRMGLRVPEDVSMISRDHEPFMNYISPQPARYVPKAGSYAEKVQSMILRVIKNEPYPDRHLKILPDFLKGESIARIG